ncbi:hypothetical protein GCM10011409_30120 [Lentibacillus populi]|uniref:Uncharacterized protein n=1 Tax=Lentibacillus populi TaxID=1827502 RepID=A0A9W5X6R8_9BACI|nr:hypothetical protein GCM10011409_30120 [Lentibacillus populi]
MLEKVRGYAAKIMKEIIHNGESVYEIDGKRYHLLKEFLSQTPPIKRILRSTI